MILRAEAPAAEDTGLHDVEMARRNRVDEGSLCDAGRRLVSIDRNHVAPRFTHEQADGRGAGRGDTRHALGARHQLPVDLAALGQRRLLRRRELKQQHRIGIEPGVNRLELDEAADEQPCADQQDSDSAT